MADLTMIGAGLDAVVRDIERLTLQQLASSGRVDQRIQKVDLALRPIMRRLRLLEHGLREHQSANQARLNQRWRLPRELRYRLQQSVGDRGRRIDAISAKLRQIHAAINELYGAAGAPRTEQEIVALAKQAGEFVDEFAELQQLVLSHAKDVADGLNTPRSSGSYGGLMATLAFMLLLLWHRGRRGDR
jgi:hypothetical protein